MSLFVFNYTTVISITVTISRVFFCLRIGDEASTPMLKLAQNDGGVISVYSFGEIAKVLEVREKNIKHNIHSHKC